MANGIADNMLITTYLSMKAPVFVAPAMDLDMFAHPSTQQNLERLRSYGNHIIEPACGELASHLEGKGRMEEPENIIKVLEGYFSDRQDLQGKRILITAGPTYEKIDPVRFIGNYSSGKMGIALAEACARRGAEVTLVCGPTPLGTTQAGIRRIDVESAEDMFREATAHFPESDAAILCAAVADFTPAQTSDRKIKRESEDLVLHLKPTRDIAQALGQMKRKEQRIIALPSKPMTRRHTRTKNWNGRTLTSSCSIRLNDPGAGFRHDTNKITIISRTDSVVYPLKSKKEVAADIVDRLVSSF